MQGKTVSAGNNVLKTWLPSFLVMVLIVWSYLPGFADSAGEQEEQPYVASKRSQVFHKSSCEWAQRIGRDNKEYFSTYDEAAGTGRRPCKVCRPGEQSPAKTPTGKTPLDEQEVSFEKEQPPRSTTVWLKPSFLIFLVVTAVLLAAIFLFLRKPQDRLMGSICLLVFAAIAFFLLHSPEDVSWGTRKATSHPYTASRSYEIFHRPSCYLASEIADEDTEFFPTFDAAIDSGRIPCGKCLPSGGHEKTTIAFWNIRKFSNRSRDDTELQSICRILKKYDMVAIAELLDERVLRRAIGMLGEMGRPYSYEISPKVGRGTKERYAFLYDSEYFEVINPGRLWPDPKDDFIREPYYATFRAGNFDFTMVIIHVIYGNKEIGPLDEIPWLGQVYTGIQDEDIDEQDVILAGDFNMQPYSSSYDNLRGIPSMTHLFRMPAKTNIANTRLYDNMWFQTRHAREYTGDKGIDRFDETDFGDDDGAASLAVSDHRPVWAAFYIDKEDDDPIILDSGADITIDRPR